jgi:hypothetical protein
LNNEIETKIFLELFLISNQLSYFDLFQKLNQIIEINQENIFEIINYTYDNNLIKLKEKCYKFLKKNINLIRSDIRKEILIEILKYEIIHEEEEEYHFHHFENNLLKFKKFMYNNNDHFDIKICSIDNIIEEAHIAILSGKKKIYKFNKRK